MKDKVVRLLIIDDELDEESTRLLNLRDAGFNVTLVNKAREIKNVLSKLRNKVDIVIVDLMMPPEGFASMEESHGGRLTGALILKEIRMQSPHVPVIVLSAHSEEDVKGKLGHIDKYLEKPVTDRKLVEIIREKIDARIHH